MELPMRGAWISITTGRFAFRTRQSFDEMVAAAERAAFARTHFLS